MSLSLELKERLNEAAVGCGQPLTHPSVASALDQQDPVGHLRKEFHFPKRAAVPHAGQKGASPDDTFIYFCGHSLGLQHRGVEAALNQELVKWRDQAVEGHFLQPNPWFEVDDVLRRDMATIVGAKYDEVVLMNTLTGNLHSLMSAFYRPKASRNKIVCERFPFPSDMHALVSQVERHGLNADECLIEVTSDATPRAEATPSPIDTQAFLDTIEKHGDTIAVILVGAVHFLTGQYFDIERIVTAAHAKDIIVGVDAAHGVGNVPLQLHDWGVDFACWCTYKYLNGGPGNIGGAFVHERLTQEGADGITQFKGWWGHQRKNRFSLHRTFEPSAGAASFQLSNPCIVGMMSLAPSLKLCAENMPRLREKSLLLTRYLEVLIETLLPHALTIITPVDPAQRGAQLSVRIVHSALRSTQASTNAYECGTDLNNDADLVQRQLLDQGIMCDNRPPDIIRLAPVPTYCSFEDVRRLVAVLEQEVFVLKH